MLGLGLGIASAAALAGIVDGAGRLLSAARPGDTVHAFIPTAGDPPTAVPRIQWAMNGVDIPGATGVSITVPDAEGTLSWSGTDSAGAAVSSAIPVMAEVPQITVIREPSAQGIGTPAPGERLSDVLARLDDAGAAVTSGTGTVAVTPGLDTTGGDPLAEGDVLRSLRVVYSAPGAADVVRVLPLNLEVRAESPVTGQVVLARTQRADGSWTVARVGGDDVLGQDATGAAYLVAADGTLEISGLASRVVDGETVDGVHLNPGRSSGSGRLYLDSRIQDVDAGDVASGAALTVAAGDTLLVGVSAVPKVVDDGYLDGVVPVWIVAAAPGPQEILGAVVGGEEAAYGVDLAARYAELSKLPVAGYPNLPDAADILGRLARYPAGYAANSNARDDRGYENHVPNGFSRVDGSGYGQYSAAVMAEAALIVLDDGSTYSEADRLAVHAGMVRIGIDCGLAMIDQSTNPQGADGGHFQEWIVPTALALHAVGRGAEIAAMRDTLGGSLRQFFRITQDFADTQLVPHDELEYVAMLRRRTLPAQPGGTTVTIPTRYGGSGGIHGDQEQIDIAIGTPVVRESDGAVAHTTVSVEFPDAANADLDLTIDTQPSPPFAEGDVIHLGFPDGVFEIGAPAWALRGDARPSYLSASPRTNYAHAQRHEGDAVTLIRALGLFPHGVDDWEVLREWTALTALGDWPRAPSEDWPSIVRIDAVSRLYGEVFADADAAAIAPFLTDPVDDTPDPVEPVEPGDPLDPVDLSRGGSLSFPVDNMIADDLDRAFALDVPVENFPRVLLHTHPRNGAFFAILRLPRTRQHIPGTMPIFSMHGGSGGEIFQLRWIGAADGDSNSRGRFYADVENASGSSKTPVWDEDAALVVVRRINTSSSQVQVDWYSLEDGTRHAGTIVGGKGAFVHDQAAPAVARIGTTHNGVPGANMGWPGEIEAMGYLTVRDPESHTEIPTAPFEAIAAGQDLGTVLAEYDVTFGRQFDGSTETLGPAAWAPGDTTGPVVPLFGAALRAGNRIMAEAVGDHLTPDPIPDGYVYGLARGETAREVPLAGSAAGRTGDVEVRIVNVVDGSVHVDWTTVGPIANGRWSGTVTVPKGDRNWTVAEYRTTGEPDRITSTRDRWGVGYKVALLGQSQMGLLLINKLVAVEQVHPNAASYLTSDNSAPEMQLEFLGARAPDGLRTFVDQMQAFDPGVPIMLIDAAVHGTGPDQLMDDADTSRSWATLQAKLDFGGNDMSVVAMNWATQGWNTRGSVAQTMEALLHGTGGYGGNIDHHLDGALRPGWSFALSPATRHSKGSHGGIREDQVAWCNANGFAVGPPVADFRIEDAGGPHQNNGFDLNGQNPNRIFGARLAVAAARALGLDASVNAHFTGVDRAGDTITVSTSAADLSALGPVSGFTVNEGSGGTSSGFTATIQGGDVVLTRDGGAWAPETVVSYSPNGFQRGDGDGEAEDAIIAGMLYAPDARDVLGLGMPVMGSTDGGAWVPIWNATTAA